MARITNPRITDANRIGSSNDWQFVIQYTAQFEPHELNLLYDDSVKIFEHDNGGSDIISAYAPIETFTSAATVDRTKFYNIRGEDLDTEIGDEEPFAWVWLRRHGSTSQFPDDEQMTPPYTDEINP